MAPSVLVHLFVVAAVAACGHPAAGNGDDADAGVDGGPTEPLVEPPPSSITTTIVRTADELVAALALATPGSVVYVADDAVLDLTGRVNLVVPPQVTLASGGGVNGVGGALLFTDQLDTAPLFKAGGAGVRFTGLRLRGPDPDIGLTPYGEPLARAIDGVRADNLQVDHAELSGWSYAAVVLDYSHRAYVHHSSIHHNRRTGLGYGIILNHDADVLVDRNTFDYNRHAIAGTGRPNTSYEARYNLIGPNRNGHAFDMHGENEADDNGSPYAGDTLRIHHNTFRGTAQGIVIRGRPKTGAYIDDNCFGQASDAGTAIIQRYFFGNLFSGGNTYSQASGTCHLGAAPGRAVRGDVNGDGLADVVTVVGGSAYSYLGSPSHALIPAPPAFAGTLKSALFDGAGHLVIDVADATGDGRADLVTAHSDGTVHVYPGAGGGGFTGGVASFAGTYPIATAALDGFEPLAVADVQGDGFADLVSQRGGTVHVHPGRSDGTFGTSVRSFAGTFDSARFDGAGHFAVDVADVTGDGRADLVTVTHAGDAYVFPGLATGAFGRGVASFAGTCHPAMLDGAGFEPVAVADVDGDGRADLISAHTSGTTYVYPGTTTGVFSRRVASFAGTMPTSLFSGDGFEVIGALDIDGDGRADLVTAHSRGDLYVYPGTATGAFSSLVRSFDGGFLTARVGPGGYEPVGEKSLLRRRGCAPSGCF